VENRGLTILLDSIASKLCVDAVALYQFDPGQWGFALAASYGFYMLELLPEFLRLEEVRDQQALFGNSSILLEDPLGFLPYPIFQKLQRSEKFKAYFAAPFKAKKGAMGMLEVYSRTTLTPDAAWYDRFKTLAGQVSIALENPTLLEEKPSGNGGLVSAYDATLEGWARALELRDKATSGHTLRVTELALRLGLALGLKEADLFDLRLGAQLHDIGKMGIPDSILFKPGPLTDEEWAIMRNHPAYGYEMLKDVSYLKPCAEIVYCHHEKWDGTGYPRGLKGEEIPFGARIVSVANVYDSLRSHHPWRPALPVAKALNTIQIQSGLDFEPKVAAAFVGLMKDQQVPLRNK
jgi:putative nucleotidyltransferase with HDIG domain